MKIFKTMIIAVLVVAAMSFGILGELASKQVDVEKSLIKWTGRKVTGQHIGTIKMKSGVMKFDNDQLTGGNFVIDMDSIICTDLEGEMKLKLERHLKSEDFFNIEEYPTAKFVITSVATNFKSNYLVTGDMTIKDTTIQEEIQMFVLKDKVIAKVTIDRTKYGINYNSGNFFEDLGDKLIYDDFKLRMLLFLK